MKANDFPACITHGVMELRPTNGQTHEQRFCGTWYDCPKCSSSVLLPSSELLAQLKTQRMSLEKQRAV
jgi:hypothetical protein